jgi:hypothetical protein
VPVDILDGLRLRGRHLIFLAFWRANRHSIALKELKVEVRTASTAKLTPSRQEVSKLIKSRMKDYAHILKKLARRAVLAHRFPGNRLPALPPIRKTLAFSLENFPLPPPHPRPCPPDF